MSNIAEKMLAAERKYVSRFVDVSALTDGEVDKLFDYYANVNEGPLPEK